MRINARLAFAVAAGLFVGPVFAAGPGTVSILPTTVVGGSPTTSTVTFTVPAGGMGQGSRVAVDLPANWYNPLQTNCPTCGGYVTVVSTTSATFAPIGVSTSGVVVGVQIGTVTAGTQIQIAFQNVYVGCAFAGQTAATWQVRSAVGPGVPQTLATLPQQTYAPAPAQWLNFAPLPSPITVASQASPPLILQAYNTCGQPTTLVSSITVTLDGQVQNPVNYSYSVDTGAVFSSTPSFSTTQSSVTVPLSGATTFYYKSPVSGSVAVVGTYTGLGASNQAWLNLTALAAAPSFANVSVDNGVASAGQTSVTITPDGTGVNSFAYIRFQPSVASQPWHVAISSNGFQTTVFERWGNGDPQSTISWGGQTSPTGTAGFVNSVVPNGTYAVKLDFGGLATNTSLSITVNTAQISGTVTLGGSPVAGAQVTAQGPGVNVTALTDGSGAYAINGLHAGNSYNLYATYVNPANQSAATGQLSNATAPATGKNFSLSTPAVVRVSAVAAVPALGTIYGNLNLHTADYSQNFFGNLRLQSGTTVSDNGDYFNSSTWTVFYVKPSTTYTLHVSMPGYGASDVTVANSSDVVLALSKQANVYGVITLPAPAAYPLWASVSGTLAGSNSPTVWGGANFNVGQSTAIYSVFAVPAGTYNFQTQIGGYAPATLSSVVVGASDLGNPNTGGEDFPAISVGGTISGTITINGDTSGMSSPINLYLNAYAPSLGYNIWTQVQLATSTTSTSASYSIGGAADGTYQMYAPYLQGFDPSSFGPQNVVVSGSATKNFVLTQETGQISGAVTLPSGHSDYNNVHLSLQGPQSIEADLSVAAFSAGHLGTGFYSLKAIYKTTGAQAQAQVNLTNGQTATVNLDLSAPTYNVSGAVSVQSAFSMKTSSGASTTINTITDLLANATNQTLYVGGTSNNGGFSVDCSASPSISTSTARVEAFPKTFNSFGNANRNGLSNCFALGGYVFGAINPDGSYSIPNLSPGVWEIDVYPYFDGSQTPNAAAQTQFITVTNTNLANVNFALGAGNAVSGTVQLPSGVTDTRSFNVQILDNRGNTIQSGSLQLGDAVTPASSANYSFTNLPAGQYSLLIQDFGSYNSAVGQNVIKYVASPVQFTINGADVTGLNVNMVRAARIVGSLGIQTTTASGATGVTLITANNTSLLPNGFQINAQADPWIPGGYGNARPSTDGTNKPAIDSNNQFSIDGLTAGTYNVTFQQNSYGISVAAAGAVNLASYTQGSVIVTQGQTVDLGTITLKPGLSVSGAVTDTNNQPLSNIVVRAQPSTNRHGQSSQQVTTDAQGNFTFAGLSPDLKIYDFIAAPRSDGGGDSTPQAPYGQASRLAVDITQVPTPTLSFALSPANASLTGHIATVDGGALAFPDSDQVGYPVAAVYMHLEGSNTDDNPLGQENATGLDGAFTVGNLVSGVYDITVESLGYQPYRVTGVSLGAATKDLGTITLQKSAELDATLARPDGSLVNTNQAQTVVAVTQDLTSIIFGQITKDASTNNIIGLKFSGFQLSPATYNVLIFDNNNNITSPPEGRNLVFTSTSDVISKALTYVPSPPFAYTDVKRAGAAGSAVTINYYFSRPLRNRGDDADPSQWFTLTNALGSLSNYTVNGDRTQMSVQYQPAAGEQNATIAFSAHTVDTDPSTGVEFVLNKSITLLLGQKATVENQINPALGGTLSLSQANDPSNVYIPANSIKGSTTTIDTTASYNFTLTATDSVGSLVSAASSLGARAAAVGSLMKFGARAYVSEAYAAMGAASNPASSINPLSSFYSILLPAGVSHSLNATAYITLNYDTNADPNLINVYYFNGTQYLLENSGRTIDAVNHTITVGVNHFSTFVVLQNSAPVVITGANATNGDVTVMNFPNPFDLNTKTLALAHGSGTDSVTTAGTVIRLFVPAAKAGPAAIRIYDVVGHKVRTINLGTPAGDSFTYVTWDGTNDAGRQVASGVYVGVLEVGGEKKFWKLAVIK